jgi:uncharacterized protein
MDTRDQQIRTWSMLCHLAAFASLLIPFGNILGPLVVWQIKKNELPEINPHGKESVNFQLTILMATIIISIFLFGSLGYGVFIQSPFTMITSGIGLALLLALVKLVSLVLVIVAAVKANNGEQFNYPSIKFIR